MSEIEEIIENLEKMADEKLFQKVAFDVINQTSKSAAKLLKTLQPHDNADLVEELKGMNEYFGKASGTHPILLKAIAALSQPRPFDLQSHCIDGHKASSKEANLIIWTDGGLVVYEALEMGPSQSLTASLMFITDWQPYTEPQLEDGLYFVSIHGNNQKLPFLLENKRWSGVDNNGHNSDRVCGMKPQTNPATNLPWIIEEPEDT